MKTKHLFYSMALVAALGACTSEELEVANDNVQDLSNRPLVGDIELVVDDAQTRLATGTGAQPVFADGDRLGACIIDAPKYNLTAGSTYAELLKNNGNDASKLYGIVEYYSSNNAFTMTDGIWKVDQPLVEGNYLFYAPYNQKMQARTALEIQVPIKQTATSEKAALDEFYKSGNVVRIGYQFLSANGGVAQKPKVVMNDVFAYPLFTIKNNFKGILDGTGLTGGKITTFNGGTIKLDSIQISQVVTATNVAVAVNYGGVIKHGETGDKIASATTEGVVGMMKPEGAWAKSPMESYTDQLLSDKVKTTKDALSEGDVRVTDVITTLICDKEIEAGKEYKVHGVLPALKYTDGTNSMRVTLYITIGGKHYKVEDASVTATESGETTTYTVADGKGGCLLTSAAGTVTLIKGQKYPQEELNFENNKLTAKSSAGTILTIDLKGGFGHKDDAEKKKAQVAVEFDPSTPAPAAEIKTNAEFEAFFKNQLNGTALEEGAKTENNTFVLATSGRTLAINSAMIDALFTYNNKGSLKFNTALPIAKDVKIADIDGTKVTFKSAAGKEYPITLDATGYLITATGSADAEIASGKTKTVIINEDCTKFTNAGKIETLYVVDGKSLTTSAIVSVQGNVINDGTIIVETGKGLTPASLVNYGTLTVKAQVGNVVENNGTINIDAAAGVTVTAGKGKIVIPFAQIANLGSTVNVAVTGGTQEGVYAGSFDKTSVEAAEKIAWINAVEITGNVAFNAEVMAAVKKINKIYATSATFTAGTFNMTGKTLVLTGNAAKTVTGAGISATTVNEISILNAGSGNVSLTNIAANGTYSNAAGVNAKITANGGDATWNGKKAE